MCVVSSVGKAMDINKQRSPKQSSQPALGALEQLDSSAGNSGRGRASQLSESSDTGSHLSLSATSPTHSSPTTQASDTSGQESDTSEKLFLCRTSMFYLSLLQPHFFFFPDVSPFPLQPRLSEGPLTGEQQDNVFSPINAQFDFSPSNLEQLQEEDQETFRWKLTVKFFKIYFNNNGRNKKYWFKSIFQKKKKSLLIIIYP